MFTIFTNPAVSQVGDSTTAGPFDLVVKTPTPGQRDLNGFLLNPGWSTDRDIAQLDPTIECGIFAFEGVRGFRSLLLRDPKCFGDEQRAILRLSEPRELVVHGLACNQPLRDGSPGGHLNWFPVTFTGALQYNGLGNPDGGDYDFTFELFADGTAPSTRWNARKIVERVDTVFSGDTPTSINTVADTLYALHTEFDYRETTRRLSRTTNSRWWSRLDSLSNDDSKSTRRAIDALLGEGRVIVTGLFNLDLVHHGHAEVHPVYAMALLDRVEPRSANEARHHWKLLVRDRGNEGNCSPEAQFVFRATNPKDTTTNRYRFNLEEPEGTSGAPRIISAESWVSSAGPMGTPVFSWVPGEGLIVTASWPNPNQKSPDAVLMAEITIAWQGDFALPGAEGGTRSAFKITDNALGSQAQMNQANAIRRMDLSDFQPEKRRHSRGADDYNAAYYDSLTSISDLTVSFDFDTIPYIEPPDPVQHAPPFSIELQPPLYLCEEVSWSWVRAPRCSSDLSFSVAVGPYIRSPWTTVGLSLQHAQWYLFLPTIPFRLDTEFAWRGASSDASSPDTSPASQIIDARLSILPHVVLFLHDTWFIATLGGGFIHESDWDPLLAFGGGLGIPVRNKGPRITLEGKVLGRKVVGRDDVKWAFYLTLNWRLL
jgi:hypothetical protein